MGNQHVSLLHSPPTVTGSRRLGQSSLFIFIIIIYMPMVINSIHAAQLDDERQPNTQQQQQQQQQSTASTTPSRPSPAGPCESKVLEEIPPDPVSKITFCMILPLRYDVHCFNVVFLLFILFCLHFSVKQNRNTNIQSRIAYVCH